MKSENWVFKWARKYFKKILLSMKSEANLQKYNNEKIFNELTIPSAFNWLKMIVYKKSLYWVDLVNLLT